MLHDDILENIRARQIVTGPRLEAMSDELREQRFKEHENEFKGKDAIILRNLYEYFYVPLKHDPAPFYFELPMFDESEAIMPPELIETGLEFWTEGILKLPFPLIMLIIDFGEAKLPCLMANWNEHGDILFILLQTSNFDYKNAIALHATIFKRDKNFTASYIPFSYEDSVKGIEAIAKEKVQITSQGFRVALACLLQMNMPHYNKESVPPIDKINKKREKNGKPALIGYTKIYLKPEIKSDLNRGSTDGGWTVRPHWRRGHIRTMADGRKIPVQPCMVNWDGDKELAKNTYEVKK